MVAEDRYIYIRGFYKKSHDVWCALGGTVVLNSICWPAWPVYGWSLAQLYLSSPLPLRLPAYLRWASSVSARGGEWLMDSRRAYRCPRTG